MVHSEIYLLILVVKLIASAGSYSQSGAGTTMNAPVMLYQTPSRQRLTHPLRHAESRGRAHPHLGGLLLPRALLHHTDFSASLSSERKM